MENQSTRSRRRAVVPALSDHGAATAKVSSASRDSKSYRNITGYSNSYANDRLRILAAIRDDSLDEEDAEVFPTKPSIPKASSSLLRPVVSSSGDTSADASRSRSTRSSVTAIVPAQRLPSAKRKSRPERDIAVSSLSRSFKIKDAWGTVVEVVETRKNNAISPLARAEAEFAPTDVMQILEEKRRRFGRNQSPDSDTASVIVLAGSPDALSDDNMSNTSHIQDDNFVDDSDSGTELFGVNMERDYDHIPELDRYELSDDTMVAVKSPFALREADIGAAEVMRFIGNEKHRRRSGGDFRGVLHQAIGAPADSDSGSIPLATGIESGRFLSMPASSLNHDSNPGNALDVENSCAAANYSLTLSICAEESKSPIIVKEEPESAYHCISDSDNIFDNSATVKIAPEAGVVMEAVIRSWMQTSPISGELYSASGGKFQTRMAKRRKANCLRFYRDLFLSDNTVACRQLLDELLEVRRLGQDYPIRKLIGQRGVFARKNIPVDTVLGFYAGIILTEGSREAQSRDLRAELCHLSGLRPGAFDTVADLNKYSFDLPLCSEYAEEHGRDGGLIVSALNRGNCLSLINGYRGEDGLPADRINVEVEVVRMDDHIPIILLIASRSISQDEELILDYGSAYFEPWAVEAMPIDIDPREIADVGEVRPFNRFNRGASNATEDFTLKVASVDELKLVGNQLSDDGVSFYSDHTNLTLRIRSDEIISAIRKQKPVASTAVFEEDNCIPIKKEPEMLSRRKRKCAR